MQLSLQLLALRYCTLQRYCAEQVEDTLDRPFATFIAGNGSLGVAGLTGHLTVKNPHKKGCTAKLGPGQRLAAWGTGDGGLDLSLAVDCQGTS